MIRRIATYAFLAMVAVAIWRGSNEDAGNVIDGGKTFISAGADAILQVWQSIFN